jgi:hypothetical protein
VQGGAQLLSRRPPLATGRVRDCVAKAVESSIDSVVCLLSVGRRHWSLGAAIKGTYQPTGHSFETH